MVMNGAASGRVAVRRGSMRGAVEGGQNKYCEEMEIRWRALLYLPARRGQTDGLEPNQNQYDATAATNERCKWNMMIMASHVDDDVLCIVD